MAERNDRHRWDRVMDKYADKYKDKYADKYKDKYKDKLWRYNVCFSW